MQSWFLHHTNPAIFPEPFSFVPERWVENPQLKPRYLLAFGRGSRSCLGLKGVVFRLLPTLSAGFGFFASCGKWSVSVLYTAVSQQGLSTLLT